MKDFLLLMDIDWTMYSEKLPEEIADKIANAKIQDIKEGEFASVKVSGLDDLLSKVGRDNLGVVSNGIADHQLKKLKGLGVADYFNPRMIIISHAIAKIESGNLGIRWDYEIAQQIQRSSDKSRFENFPEYQYMKKWEKPSSRMVELAYKRFLAATKINLPSEQVFYLGDRQWDMRAITSFGGCGLHVKTLNNDSLDGLTEHARSSIIDVKYEDYPRIPEIIEKSRLSI